MEAAWREVEQGAAGPGAGVERGDPDLQAVWDEQDDAGLETLEGVWGRTAARLEAGEGETGGRLCVCVCVCNISKLNAPLSRRISRTFVFV